MIRQWRAAPPGWNGHSPVEFPRGSDSMSIKHILVPIDFSQTTPHSIGGALDLARKFSAQITLYHVVQLMHPPGLEPIFKYEKEIKAFQDEAEKQLRKLAGSI